MPNNVQSSREEITERIRRIYQSAHLAEDEKERLIAALLESEAVQVKDGPSNLALAYLVSVILSPAGLFIGIHYFIRYGDDGYRPGTICIVLTVIALVLELLIFRKVLTALLNIHI